MNSFNLRPGREEYFSSLFFQQFRRPRSYKIVMNHNFTHSLSYFPVYINRLKNLKIIIFNLKLYTNLESLMESADPDPRASKKVEGSSLYSSKFRSVSSLPMLLLHS